MWRWLGVALATWKITAINIFFAPSERNSSRLTMNILLNSTLSIQPNDETREKQLEAWSQLVLAHFRHTGQHVLDLGEAASSPLFNNTAIDRE